MPLPKHITFVTPSHCLKVEVGGISYVWQWGTLPFIYHTMCFLPQCFTDHTGNLMYVHDLAFFIWRLDSCCASVSRHYNKLSICGKCSDEKTTQATKDLHKAGLTYKEICVQKSLKLCTWWQQRFTPPKRQTGRPEKVTERTRKLNVASGS